MKTAAGAKAATLRGPMSWFRWLRRQCAHRSLAEVFPFDAKGVVEAGTVVFPCDPGGQFHELRISEFLAEAGKEGFGDFYRSSRHRVRVFEHEALKI